MKDESLLLSSNCFLLVRFDEAEVVLFELGVSKLTFNNFDGILLLDSLDECFQFGLLVLQLVLSENFHVC